MFINSLHDLRAKLFFFIHAFKEEYNDLIIVIKQQIMIAIGYPSSAIMNPTMNIANGMYNASLIFNALFKYSSFS